MCYEDHLLIVPHIFLKQLYEAIIRSRLEYCCIAWDPHCESHRIILERIQKRCVRMMCSDWETSYEHLLNQMRLCTLEKRRLYYRLVACYKLQNNLMLVNYTHKFTYASRIGRNDHSLKLKVPFARTDYYMNSFYVNTARDWNKLPQYIINSPSLISFKRALKLHLHIV